MATTYETVTDAQIQALRETAGQAGDGLQVALCDIALGASYDELDLELLNMHEQARVVGMMPREARRECARVIADAEAR